MNPTFSPLHQHHYTFHFNSFSLFVMRAFIVAAVVLVSVQQALAQDAITTSAPWLSPAEASAAHASIMSERSSWFSSRSSIIGTFYDNPVYLFMPNARDGDFVSAVGSDGPNAETTTWEVYNSYYIIGPGYTKSPKEPRWAYQTMTIGPTTYIESSMARCVFYISHFRLLPSAQKAEGTNYHK